ncbi:MFS transporter [Novosphingobium cyanobacteriorum]|uniref:MFS transporter n=1 Tax=Novosphingobium cyanobacteriorum TaxID=3024215 RepID=UPI0028BED871|nr:MFS transporter [Novosphingobium cyanobacteriorum]
MGRAEFVALMAMTMALQALAIDAMLPALGEIARDLHVTDPNRRQLVVGVFLISAGFGALIPGALADRYGRRPVLLGSLILYVALSAACALAPTFNALLVLRAVQAVGSAGLAVLPSAIIRDRHEGDAMARLMSTISMVFMLIPMLAPTLGQAVQLFAGWRWIFGILGVMGTGIAIWVLLRLPETLRPEYRQEIMPLSIVRNMVQAAVNRQAFG